MANWIILAFLWADCEQSSVCRCVHMFENVACIVHMCGVSSSIALHLFKAYTPFQGYLTEPEGSLFGSTGQPTPEISCLWLQTGTCHHNPFKKKVGAALPVQVLMLYYQFPSSNVKTKNSSRNQLWISTGLTFRNIYFSSTCWTQKSIYTHPRLQRTQEASTVSSDCDY